MGNTDKPDNVVPLFKKGVTGVVVEEGGEYRTVFTTSGYDASKQVIIKTAPKPEKELLDDRIGLVSDIGAALEVIGPPTLIRYDDRGHIRTFARTSEGTDYVVLEEIDLQ